MKRKHVTTFFFYGVPIVVVLIIFVLISKSATTEFAGERVNSQGNTHIQTVDSPHASYSTTPPTSGPHVGRITSWGVSRTQIPDEIQIHNLEDGGVILHYGPEVSEEDIAAMTSLIGRYERVILEPYEGMQSAIVLTAWGRIDYLDEFDGDRILNFIKAYHGADHHAR